MVKYGILLSTIGVALYLLLHFLLPNGPQSIREALGSKAAPSALNNKAIQKLTDRIQDQRDSITRLENDLNQASTTLIALHKDITTKREALNTADAAAVVQFNEAAATYQKQNERVKQLTQNLATARTELSDLLDERAKQMPVAKQTPPSPEPSEAANSQVAKGPKIAKIVVIYTTSHCGYCVKAKQYLSQKGVGYQEMNVESSQSAQDEFRKLGGNGVPLIVIGDKRIHGFSPGEIDAALQ